MSLADRLADIKKTRTNKGCITCIFLTTLKPDDRRALDQWIKAGWSLTQLWEACCVDGLDISITGFRHHVRHHKPL